MSETLLGTISTSALMLVIAKITLLLGLAVLGARLLRRATAGVRHLWWLVVLLATLLIPVLEMTQPVRLAVLPVLGGSASVRTQAATQSDVVDGAANGATLNAIGEASPGATVSLPGVDVPVAPSSVASDTPGVMMQVKTYLQTQSPLMLIAMVWCVGMLVTAAWLLRSWIAAARIVRRANVVSAPDWLDPLYEVADRIGLDDVPRVVRSADVRMPFACGVRKPTIVLPLSSDTWSMERRQAVLLHELAHVRRNDLLGHTFARLVCVVYWFHPMVWMAAGALRAESEQACDDLAVSSGTRPSDYAEHLLDIVTSVKGDATPAVAIAMARRSEFEGRMLAILDPERPRRNTTRRQGVTLAGLIGAVTLLVGAAAPVVPAATPLTAQKSHDDSLPYDAAQADAEMQTTISSDSVRRGVRPQPSPVISGIASPEPAASPDAMSREQPVQPPADPSTRLNRRINDAAQDVITRLSVGVSTSVVDAFGMGGRSRLANAGMPGLDSMPVGERVRLLVRLLNTDSSASIRRVAAWGLNEYQAVDGSVRAALISALRRDADEKVREMAAWALADERGARAEAGSALINAVRSDASARVRATASWAIGTLDVREAEPVLIKALDDPEASVRYRAAWALGSITPERVPAGLTSHLADSSRQVRRAVAWVLHQIGDQSAAPAIMRAFRAEKDQGVRRDLFRALVSMGENSTDFIKEMLDSNDNEIREQ
ncbi:MAG TPA: M56 family metallopeptidase, partial [Gemmatimonas sp.]|uniref:M56 family metallopeptidase n=1 Tax=Gemmatimonas sp. TaxID=1962908 RepID=UPI002EDB3206